MGDRKDNSTPRHRDVQRGGGLRLPSISLSEEIKLIGGSSGSPLIGKETDTITCDSKVVQRKLRSRNDISSKYVEHLNREINQVDGNGENEAGDTGVNLGPKAYLSKMLNTLATENAANSVAERSMNSVNQGNGNGGNFRTSQKKKTRNNDFSSHHRPAEIFRKDLISAMKIPDTSQLLAEDYWVMQDSWRMEWEKGVQVPVNENAAHEVKVTVIVKELKGGFRIPRKMIKSTPDVGDRETVDLNVLADSMCRYDLDEVDVAWLYCNNEERSWMGYPPLDECTMEIILEELETQCHENMQLAIKTKKGLGIEYDENIVCDVCRSPDCEEGNEMVFCDGCNLCVHQACYGILKVPEGSWLCKPCALGVRVSTVCILCGKKGGAMKSTRSGHKWAHVSCALWIPEITIADPDRMEPITKVSHIPSSRWSLVCSVCKERSVGACIQCSVRHCVTAYHVTCAIESRFDMITDYASPNSSPVNNGDNTIIFRSFCQKHSKNCRKKSGHGEKKTEEQKRSDRQRRIAELEEEFHTFVKSEAVANELNIPQETAIQVMEYWKLKRRANFNRPLIMPKHEEGKALAEAAESGLQRRLKMFMHLRQDLERVRNLCYMIGRREKIKRSSTKNMENVFLAQMNYVENRMSQNKHFNPETLIPTIPKFGMREVLKRAKKESQELAMTKEWNQKNPRTASSPAQATDHCVKEVSRNQSQQEQQEKGKMEDDPSSSNHAQSQYEEKGNKIPTQSAHQSHHKKTKTGLDDNRFKAGKRVSLKKKSELTTEELKHERGRRLLKSDKVATLVRNVSTRSRSCDESDGMSNPRSVRDRISKQKVWETKSLRNLMRSNSKLEDSSCNSDSPSSVISSSSSPGLLSDVQIKTEAVDPDAGRDSPGKTQQMTIMTETISETKRISHSVSDKVSSKRHAEDGPDSSCRNAAKIQKRENRHCRQRSNRDTHVQSKRRDTISSPSSDSTDNERNSSKNLHHRRQNAGMASPAHPAAKNSPDPEKNLHAVTEMRNSSRRQSKNEKGALASLCDQNSMVCDDMKRDERCSSPNSPPFWQGLVKDIRTSPLNCEPAVHLTQSTNDSSTHEQTVKRRSVRENANSSSALWDVESKAAWKAIGLDVSYGSNCPAVLRSKRETPPRKDNTISSLELRWVPLSEDSDEQVINFNRKIGLTVDRGGYRGDMEESDSGLLPDHLLHHHRRNRRLRKRSSEQTKDIESHINLSPTDELDPPLAKICSKSLKKIDLHSDAKSKSENILPFSQLQNSNLLDKTPQKYIDRSSTDSAKYPTSAVPKNEEAVGGILGGQKCESDFKIHSFHAPTTDGNQPGNSMFHREIPLPTFSDHYSSGTGFISSKLENEEIFPYTNERMKFCNPLYPYAYHQPWQDPHTSLPSIVPNQFPLPVFYQYPPIPQVYKKRNASMPQPDECSSPPQMPDSTLSPESFTPTSASVAVQASVPEANQGHLSRSQSSSQTAEYHAFNADEEDNEWEIVADNRGQKCYGNEDSGSRHSRKHKKKKKKKKRRRMRFPSDASNDKNEESLSGNTSLQDPIHGAIVPHGQALRYDPFLGNRNDCKLESDHNTKTYHKVKRGNSIDNITPILSKLSHDHSWKKRRIDRHSENTSSHPKKLVLKINKRHIKIAEDFHSANSSSSHVSSSTSSISDDDVANHEPVTLTLSPQNMVCTSGSQSLKMKFKISRSNTVHAELLQVKSKQKHGKKQRFAVVASEKLVDSDELPNGEKKTQRISNTAALRRLGLAPDAVVNYIDTGKVIGGRTLRERKPIKQKNNPSVTREPIVGRKKELKRYEKSQSSSSIKRRSHVVSGIERKIKKEYEDVSGGPKTNNSRVKKHGAMTLKMEESADVQSTLARTGVKFGNNDGKDGIGRRGRPRREPQLKVSKVVAKVEANTTIEEEVRHNYQPKDQARFAGWSTKTSKTTVKSLSASAKCDFPCSKGKNTPPHEPSGTNQSISLDVDHHNFIEAYSSLSSSLQPARHWKKRKVHEHEHEKQRFQHEILESRKLSREADSSLLISSSKLLTSSSSFESRQDSFHSGNLSEARGIKTENTRYLSTENPEITIHNSKRTENGILQVERCKSGKKMAPVQTNMIIAKHQQSTPTTKKLLAKGAQKAISHTLDDIEKGSNIGALASETDLAMQRNSVVLKPDRAPGDSSSPTATASLSSYC